MAVRLDADTVSSLVGPDLTRVGREHLDQGRVFELGPEDSGVAATVLNSVREEFDVWVGVVNGALTGECDCDEEGPLCSHAVAVTLAAIEDGIPFTSVTEQDGDDDEERFAEAAARLTFDQLVDLVVRQALADPDFADELMALAEDPEE